MRAPAIRLSRIVLAVALVVGGCGNGSLTLSEYTEQAEQHLKAMNDRIDLLGAEWVSQTPTLEGARGYWEGRLSARTEFLEELEALDPPDEVAELHRVVLDLLSRFTAAEEALAASVDAYESITDHWQWQDSPEAQAALALNEEVVALCHAAQADFDATQTGEGFVDTPWIPDEMKEAIRVTLECRDP
jgi:hypothetical protein